MVRLPSVMRYPLLVEGSPMSIRSLPGNEAASYQVSTFVVPSALNVVLFCVNVTVLYHEAWYRSCMARIRDSPSCGSCATASVHIKHAIEIITIPESFIILGRSIGFLQP